jgi:hypothetical protein
MSANPGPGIGWAGPVVFRGQVERAWSRVMAAHPAASVHKGFSRPVSEGEREALYDVVLSSIIGPSLAEAEEDLSAGRTFTLDEWLADDDG